MAENKKQMLQKATFAAGCFWGVEYQFQKLPGLKETRVGYTGGKIKNPTYEQVCSDKTQHAEAVEIIFNPEIISYEKLLEVFWKSHDPTTMNMQWPDVGSQYRSAIFYHNAEQKRQAEKSLREIQKKIPKKIVTEITKASEFYSAEDYHQDYVKKHGENSCHIARNPYL